MRRLSLLASALVATFAAIPAAQAWGPLGHAVVADLAQAQLTPEAKAEVLRLLALDHTQSLADIASWPDEIRNDQSQQALWKETRGLHYIDFDGDCNYTPPRDCKDGECVVEAIPHYVAILADRKQSDAAREQALKFVVHFIGDIHQPLHANFQNDAGGNKYQVQFEDKGTNLHKVWDSGLLGTRHLDAQAYAAKLQAEGPVKYPPRLTDAKNPAVQWAEESCQITRKIYPANHKIDGNYVQAELPIADDRLRQAGARLAKTLNMALKNG